MEPVFRRKTFEGWHKISFGSFSFAFINQRLNLRKKEL